MNWNSERPSWKIQRLEPEHPTDEFCEKVKNVEGMIRRLQEHAMDSPLVGSCFRLARVTNLNQEQTFALLAYHAVKMYEQLLDAEMERMMLAPPAPIMNLGR